MMLLRRAADVVVLVAVYLFQILRTTAEVAHMVLTPGVASSAVIAVELESTHPWTVTSLANLISLTPGTITLHVAEDGSRLYVHVLATRPLDDLRAELDGLQQRVLKVLP